MEFEWDENKNAINKVKHGIDFRDAVPVFYDPHVLVREDNGDYGEQRFQIIGMSKKGVLMVAYTERHEDTIRIISARSATKNERRTYENDSFY